VIEERDDLGLRNTPGEGPPNALDEDDGALAATPHYRSGGAAHSGAGGALARTLAHATGARATGATVTTRADLTGAHRFQCQS
jgi:hypothetical protein